MKTGAQAKGLRSRKPIGTVIGGGFDSRALHVRAQQTCPAGGNSPAGFSKEAKHRVQAIVNVAEPKGAKDTIRLAILLKCSCGRMRRPVKVRNWSSGLAAAVDFERTCRDEAAPLKPVGDRR